MTTSRKVVKLPLDEKFYLYGYEGDYMTGRMLEHRGWEHRQTLTMKSFVRPGWLVVDVGAGLGYYTMLASKLVGPRGKVYAFEPNPDNYALVVRARKEQGTTNVWVFAQALGDAPRETTFARNPGNDGDGRVGGRLNPNGWPSVPVSMTTLDKVMAWKKPVVRPGAMFIKVDIQGCEPQFLDGAAVTIRKYQPIIIMENSPGHLRMAGYRHTIIPDMMRALGYEVHNIKETRDLICTPR